MVGLVYGNSLDLRSLSVNIVKAVQLYGFYGRSKEQMIIVLGMYHNDWYVPVVWSLRFYLNFPSLRSCQYAFCRRSRVRKMIMKGTSFLACIIMTFVPVILISWVLLFPFTWHLTSTALTSHMWWRVFLHITSLVTYALKYAQILSP